MNREHLPSVLSWNKLRSVYIHINVFNISRIFWYFVHCGRTGRVCFMLINAPSLTLPTVYCIRMYTMWRIYTTVIKYTSVIFCRKRKNIKDALLTDKESIACMYPRIRSKYISNAIDSATLSIYSLVVLQNMIQGSNLKIMYTHNLLYDQTLQHLIYHSWFGFGQSCRGFSISMRTYLDS